MANQDEPHSLEHIHASELYPKRKLVTEDKTLQVPFPLLSGESVEFLGRTVDGVIALSNFRLLVRFKDSFVNVPLGLVEQIEMRDIFYLNIYCKDATVVRCAFCTNDACLEWFKRLTTSAASPKKMEDIYAFAFHAWCVDNNPCAADQESCYQLCQPDEKSLYSFGKEAERMQFDLKNAWRISYANEDYKLCPSYPKQHIIPRSITDEDLANVANFRALHRFPSVVWRDQRNGAVITRCSQPELGWLGWRSSHDENLLKAIPQACAVNADQDKLYNYEKEDGPGDPLINGVEAASGDDKHEACSVQPKKMLIIDARSYGAAFANRAKGGGCECAEYYPSCEIQFMNLPNIHSIRKSFQALRLLCAGGPDQANWLSSLENTKWLHNIGAILKATYLVVNAIDKDVRPVLVHCSDGWDRTSQIVALSELLLDPYYRTIEGFQVLVEREWLTFGHKFADRCGQSVTTDDTSERCPVFMQWLDCVHQVLKQFPCAFEFNEAFLVKLVQHTYSCLFGTFLCNSAREREEERIREKTSSVWSLLKPNNKRFYNYLYCHTSEQVLRPSCHIRNILLWSAVYLSNNFSAMGPEDTVVNTVEETPTPDAKSEVTSLQKTRSCDDIVAALEHSANSNRRLSDPNIALDLTVPAEHIALQVLDNDNTTSELQVNGASNCHISSGPAVLETTSLDECTPGINGKGVQTNGHSHEESDVETEGEDSDIRVLMKESIVDINGDDSVLVESSLIEEGITNGVVEEICNSLINSPPHRHLNGVVNSCDSSNLQTVKSGSTKTLTGSLNSLDQVPHVIEGSTDTLVEDDEVRSKQSSCTSLTNGHSQTTPTTTTSTNGHCGSQQNGFHSDSQCEQKSPISRVKSVGNSTSISTSTTDLTDSHVHVGIRQCDTSLPPVNGDCSKFQESMLSLKLPFRATPMALKLNCNCDIPFSNGVNRTSNPSQGSAPSTPFSSRSSTCPPTPGAESSGKLSDSPLQRQMSGLSRHLDTDGLTTFTDPGQIRMEQLELEYQQKLESMERQLQLMRMAFQQYTLVQNGHGRTYDTKDDMIVIPDGGCSEFHSLGNNSNASDVSWEQIDERESNMTMWIPDHAVTHCAGCEGAFWMAKRKHHCRNCGKIFCNDCSNNYVPIPQQQLQDPARVCNGCFSSIRVDGSQKLNFLPEIYLENHPIATTVSH